MTDLPAGSPYRLGPVTMQPRTAGVLFMVLMTFSLTTSDVFMKLALREASLFQAVFLRGLAATAILAGMAWSAGQIRTAFTRPERLLVGRVVAELLGTLCFYTALANIQLADATAILQLSPIAIAVGANFAFGDRLGWKRVCALLVGLLGALLIIRPATPEFNPYAWFAVLAVLFIAGRDLGTRGLRSRVPAVTVAFLTALMGMVVGFVLTWVTGWSALSLDTVLYLVGAGVLLSTGYMFNVLSMRVGEVTVSLTFRYASLLWSSLATVLVFGQSLSWLTIAGATVIVLAGLSTMRQRP